MDVLQQNTSRLAVKQRAECESWWQSSLSASAQAALYWTARLVPKVRLCLG